MMRRKRIVVVFLTLYLHIVYNVNWSSVSILTSLHNESKALGPTGTPTPLKENLPQKLSEDELRRLRRAEAVLLKRIGRNLIVILEGVANERNHDAILRTCEALGIQHVWLVQPANNKVQKTTNRYVSLYLSKTASRFLSLRFFPSATDCAKELKKDGYEIWATDVSEKSQDILSLLDRMKSNFSSCSTTPPVVSKLNDHSKERNHRPRRERPFPDKLAVVFGSEITGVSNEMFCWADRRVNYALSGFTESLNVGVAAGIVLTTILRFQPSLIGSLIRQREDATVVRARWYMGLARTDRQKELFPSYIHNPPTALNHTRPTDKFRTPRFKPRPLYSVPKLSPVTYLHSLNKSNDRPHTRSVAEKPFSMDDADVRDVKEDRQIEHLAETKAESEVTLGPKLSKLIREEFGDIENEKRPIENNPSPGVYRTFGEDRDVLNTDIWLDLN